MKKIISLLRKDFITEYREKYATSSLFLYVFVTVFTIYISLFEIRNALWVTLFWIIILFVSVNAAIHSLARESARRQLYYYALVHPVDLFLSKLIFNCLFLLVAGLLCYAGMSMIGESPVADLKSFVAAFVLGSIGLAAALTLTAQLAMLASRSMTLMAVLSFPVLLPVLLQSISISVASTAAGPAGPASGDFLLLAGIDLLILAVSLWLFPYLWRK